jgi:hypothetical protein
MWCIGGDGLEVLFGEEEFDHVFQSLGGIVPEDEEGPVEEPGALVEGLEGGDLLGVDELFDGEADGFECGGCLVPVFEEDFAGEFSPEDLEEVGVDGGEVVDVGVSGFLRGLVLVGCAAVVPIVVDEVQDVLVFVFVWLYGRHGVEGYDVGEHVLGGLVVSTVEIELGELAVGFDDVGINDSVDAGGLADVGDVPVAVAGEFVAEG